MRRAILPSLLTAGALSATVPAQAGSFAEDGSFVFDPETEIAIDFEAAEGEIGTDDPGALAGGRVLPLSVFQGEEIPLPLFSDRATYRVSAWVRGSEVAAYVELRYAPPFPDAAPRTDEIAVLYPTGRLTSDGWIELANEGIRVDGTKLVDASLGLFTAEGAAVDAVEIRRDGDLDALGADPNPPCEGAAGAGAACAPDQVCLYATCRNVRSWVPPIPADRDDVTAYLEARLRLLFGPFREREVDLPTALTAIDGMRHADDPWAFWNGFLLAVRRLHDGHTTTGGIADFVTANPRPLAVCFLEGDADRSHAVAPADPLYRDVLVSHVGADHALGLGPGDRLVRIDGQHPIAWYRSLVAFNWSQPAISNHETFAELASSLRSAIPRYAHTIEVVRCDAQADACGPVEAIDVSAIPFDPPDTPFDGRVCDNRPLRHLLTSPADHAVGEAVHSGLLLESDPDEAIFGLEWESLSTTNGFDGVGPDLKDAVNLWRDQARGVILDHRVGFGGTIKGPEILWRFSVPKHASDVYQDRQRAEDEQPTIAEGLAVFDAAVADGTAQIAGSDDADLETPVALLVTEDVSASDWLPHGMKGAPKTRVFGPYQTNGGFSTRYAFGYWFGMSYVIAVGDTYAPDGTTMNGHGVPPDVVVLPKQSDLMAGRDPVFEAALAWIREELAVVPP